MLDLFQQAEIDNTIAPNGWTKPAGASDNWTPSCGPYISPEAMAADQTKQDYTSCLFRCTINTYNKAIHWKVRYAYFPLAGSWGVGYLIKDYGRAIEIPISFWLGAFPSKRAAEDRFCKEFGSIFSEFEKDLVVIPDIQENYKPGELPLEDMFTPQEEPIPASSWVRPEGAEEDWAPHMGPYARWQDLVDDCWPYQVVQHVNPGKERTRAATHFSYSKKTGLWIFANWVDFKSTGGGGPISFSDGAYKTKEAVIAAGRKIALADLKEKYDAWVIDENRRKQWRKEAAKARGISVEELLQEEKDLEDDDWEEAA